MALQAHVDSKSAAPPAEVAQPWGQQPEENELWYVRFLRYVALGPGRSVSLVAKGRRNAYPVPAHWPIQASQHSWKSRASAFDVAVLAALRKRVKPDDEVELIANFNARLASCASKITNSFEQAALQAAIAQGGYQLPPSLDEDEYKD